jgi:hypothetical protein
LDLGRFNPVDLALFARALLLAKRAQDVRTVPISALVEDLKRRGGRLGRFSADRLVRASERASTRWASWFGGKNTCLVRSLILGALLADRREVVLNVGFRSDDDPEPRLAGHAWVTVEGRPLGGDGRLAENSYTRVLEIPFCLSPRVGP